MEKDHAKNRLNPLSKPIKQAITAKNTRKIRFSNLPKGTRSGKRQLSQIARMPSDIESASAFSYSSQPA
jgi:hypothetical protein